MRLNIQISLPAVMAAFALFVGPTQAAPKQHSSPYTSRKYVPIHAPRVSYYAVLKLQDRGMPARYYKVWYSNGMWLKKPGQPLPKFFSHNEALAVKSAYLTYYFDGSYPDLVWESNPLGFCAPGQASDRSNLGRLYHLYGKQRVDQKYHIPVEKSVDGWYDHPDQIYPFGFILISPNEQPFKRLNPTIQRKGTAKVAGRTCDVYTNDMGTYYIDAATHIVLRAAMTAKAANIDFTVVRIQYTKTYPRSLFQLPPGTRVWRPLDYIGLKLPHGVRAITMPASIAATGIVH